MATGVRPVVGRLRGGGRGWILLATATGWLLILGGRFLIPAVLPQVKDGFAVGNTGGGIAITIAWATYALVQSPAGLLSDRVGERRLLAGSLMLSAGSVVGLGIAPVFVLFLVGCAVFGFATGLFGPARGTVLSRAFPDDDSTAIGVTIAAGSVGSAVLPFLAGSLVGAVGWRAIVAGLAPPLALAGGFAWWAISDREAPASASSSPGALLGDVIRSVQSRGVGIAVVGITLMLFAFQGLSTFFVTYLVTSKGFDQRLAAGMLSLLFVGAAVSQVAGGLIADRIHERVVFVVAAGIGVVSIGTVPFVDGLLPVAVVSLLLGAQRAVVPVSNAYTIAVLPDSVTGTVWGVLRTAFILVGATGSTVVGVMADRGLFDESFLLLAATAAVATGLYLFLPSRAVTAR